MTFWVGFFVGMAATILGGLLLLFMVRVGEDE